MFCIYVEMPSGARSRGYEFDEQEVAFHVFDAIKRQLQSWKNFSADLVMESAEGKITERFENA